MRFSSIRFASNPLIARLKSHPRDKIAIRHVISGNSYTYGRLVDEIGLWRSIVDKNSGTGNRIAIMGENSFQFISSFFASLTLPNTFAVPLCTNHTDAEIQYQLEDSGANLIITPERFRSKFDKFSTKKLIMDDYSGTQLKSPDYESADSSGYMIYTSGTSGKPKGVVTPLQTSMAQANALIQAWKFSNATSMLQTLPLHHVHGLLIGSIMPLLSGGRLDYLFPFDAAKVIERLTDESLPSINTYTAVPTIYARLISHVNGLEPTTEKEAARTAFSKLKLAMCGSAALPQPLRDSWDELCHGKVPLLERYGMSETGITFSQPLDQKKRVAGSIGGPVPTVEARLSTEDNKIFKSDSPGVTKTQGEIQLNGPLVFSEYWNKPEASAETFTEDGWFKTGDVAKIDEHGNWFIMGRASMDIIKSGGEKISALEIERELLGLSEISECSVVGVESKEWGQQIGAVIVLTDTGKKEKFDLKKLKLKLKGEISGYKIPKLLKIVDQIPRNQMGKVNKKSLVKIFDE